MKRIISAVAAALVCGVVAALAANTTFFTSNGDLVFPFSPPTTNPAGAGTIDNMTIGATTPRAGSFTTGTFTGTVTAPQINSTLGTYQKNPASSTSYPAYTFSAAQRQMIFDIGSTVTYAYITLAAAPIDGQVACFFSAAAITTLYVYANTGQSIVNAASTLAAQGHNCYLYSASNTSWDRAE